MNLPVGGFSMDYNELYLTYVDPNSNTLKEVQPDSMYLKMKNL